MMELREVAKYFVETESCTCDPDSGVFNCIGCDVKRMAEFVLRHTSSDPLTVKLASEVVGREPDGAYGREAWWHIGEFTITMYTYKDVHVDCDWSCKNPTLGQFTSLVESVQNDTALRSVQPKREEGQ